MKKPSKLINEILPKIQQLVNAEFVKVGGNPDPYSSLDQLNLLGGDKIVREYLIHGEVGVAFDHLNYMIDETDVKLDSNLVAKLAEIAKLIS
jgi:hypothetical protein